MSRKVCTVSVAVPVFIAETQSFVIMPRKRKQAAHLTRLNILRKKASDVVPPSPACSLSSGSDADESQAVLTDDDSYWPREEEIEIVDLADSDLRSLVLKWVPEARPNGKAPHIGVSRWTTWRHQSEIEKRAKSMAGNKTLFEFWNIQRPSDKQIAVAESPTQPIACEDQQDVRRRKALEILQDTFH